MPKIRMISAWSFYHRASSHSFSLWFSFNSFSSPVWLYVRLFFSIYFLYISLFLSHAKLLQMHACVRMCVSVLLFFFFFHFSSLISSQVMTWTPPVWRCALPNISQHISNAHSIRNRWIYIDWQDWILSLLFFVSSLVGKLLSFPFSCWAHFIDWVVNAYTINAAVGHRCCYCIRSGCCCRRHCYWRHQNGLESRMISCNWVFIWTEIQYYLWW